MNRDEYRSYAKQRRIDARKKDMYGDTYKNETERSLDEQEEEFTVDKTTGKIKSTKEHPVDSLKRGVEYTKEIQEVADFWRSLYNSKAVSSSNQLQKKILFQLSEDGISESWSRNESFSFGNLKKQYQVLVFDSYYAYKSGKGIKKESEMMLEMMLEAKLIKTPKQKTEEKLLNTNVTCWNCDDPNQKIISLDEVFHCSKCDESLWTGEGGYVLVGGKYK